MLFLPYKLDVSLYKVPILTGLVCLICLGTFSLQLKSRMAFETNLLSYCAGLNANLKAILNSIDDKTVGQGCKNVLMGIRNSPNPDAKITELAGKVHNLEFDTDKAVDIKYKGDSLKSGYADFDTLVPKDLTLKLAYGTDRYNIVTMVTSTFAHASWDHLLGNLFFFFIFASCLESVLGYRLFFLAFALMTITTNLAYSYSIPAADILPTVGLSGVAMGMMAMLTTLLPRAKIWCFFWFLLFIRRFTLPVLVIAIWYVGWDVYDLQHNQASSHINYMAHVSGAITGIILGVLYRLFASRRLETATMEVIS